MRLRDEQGPKLAVPTLQTLTFPPLWERRSDIEHMALHFLKQFADETYHTNLKLSPKTLSIFQKHDWPGNCRELQNVV